MSAYYQQVPVPVNDPNALPYGVVVANPNPIVAPIQVVVAPQPLQPVTIVSPDVHPIIQVAATAAPMAPPVMIEGIVIPPDPEGDDDLSDDMNVDVETEVEYDLLSVIGAMRCHRIISFIGFIVLCVLSILFFFFGYPDSALLFFILSIIQLIGFCCSYKYSKALLSLMKWLYIVGIILSVAYVGIFWYDIIMDSHLNDLLEILVLFMYVLLAVLQCIYFRNIRYALVHIPPSQHSLIPFMERENRDTIKPSLRIF
ncbi:hypothetical protein WA588_005656 [Blastocystis sp. NMH]